METPWASTGMIPDFNQSAYRDCTRPECPDPKTGHISAHFHATRSAVALQHPAAPAAPGIRQVEGSSGRAARRALALAGKRAARKFSPAIHPLDAVPRV